MRVRFCAKNDEIAHFPVRAFPESTLFISIGYACFALIPAQGALTSKLTALGV
jgi:hypothetical protein